MNNKEKQHRSTLGTFTMNAPCRTYIGSVRGSLRCIFIGGKSMERESFILYTRLYELVKDLTLEQKGVLFDAIHHYANGEAYTITDPATEMAFRFYRNQMEMDFRKWEDVRQKRIEAGKQGGRPKKEENQTKTKKANGFSENQTKAKKPVNVNDNVNVNVNDNECIKVSEKPKRTRTKFEKPTLQEVKSYVFEKSYIFDPETFYAFYESNGWKVGSNPMKDWKAACTTWNKKEKEIKERNNGNRQVNTTGSFYNSNANIEDAQRRMLQEIAESLL